MKKTDVFEQIKRYKRKSIISLIFMGIAFSTLIILSAFLLFSYLEHVFWFNKNVRTFLYFSFCTTVLYLFIKKILQPILHLFWLDKIIDDENAAQEIGRFFPSINDKLLNVIQLMKLNNTNNPLIRAGINQKTLSLPDTNFSNAISIQAANKRWLYYLIFPLFLLVSLLIFKPEVITQSSIRIKRFNEDFVPKAPFEFIIKNSNLSVFEGENKTIELEIKGNSLPANVFINQNDRLLQMINQKNHFSFEFKNIWKPTFFYFEGGGFRSKTYQIEVLYRPDLHSFKLHLNYPKYLRKNKETIDNLGNVTIPEGTKIRWQLITKHAKNVTIGFDNNKNIKHLLKTADNIFEYQNTFIKNQTYQVLLTNDSLRNKDVIQYNINVIKDEFPKIQNSIYQDTILYSFVSFSGYISDDYGLKELNLNYRINDNEKFIKLNIPIDANLTNQKYYYSWQLDSLTSFGNSLNYYLEVSDNDGFNGSKSSKTPIYTFKIPNKKDLDESVKEETVKTEKNINRTIQKAKEIREQIDKINQKIKGKKSLSWQEIKEIEKLIKQKNKLEEDIKNLNKQYFQNEMKRQKIEKPNKETAKKIETLQKLMEDILDEETKALYQELEKLLEKESQKENIQNVLEKLQNKEVNLENELERTLELFQKLKFDNMLNNIVHDLKEQTNEQKSLINKTKKNSKKNTDLSYDQKLLQEKLNSLEEKYKELKNQNQSLKHPEVLPDITPELKSIKENQTKSKEFLDNNSKNKSLKPQEKAKDGLKNLSEKLSSIQQSMEMIGLQENLDDLRLIINNLIHLSFEQEDIMVEFGKVNLSDPRFIELSQKQLKIKDDSKIVYDSLMALASRVFQIESFVTREVNEMNEHINESIELIRDRYKNKAISEQQFTMTSMNNLSLLLDDVLTQMQQNLAEAMGIPKKEKNGSGKMSISQLQKNLNEKINALKKSGKTGRKLSEQLAKLAAEQSRIRKLLENEQNKINTEKGNSNDELMKQINKKMEQTETDLINKQITEETINRQKDILTRLLENENALQEKGVDKKRESKRANEYKNQIPPSLELYLKEKETEIELFKTIPPILLPHYKKEVTEYFKKIDTN